MERKINIELTHLEAFDIAQYFVNTLEMLQRIEVKNGGLHYHEARIRNTFKKVTAEVFNGITTEEEINIINQINKGEREYNQTKNN